MPRLDFLEVVFVFALQLIFCWFSFSFSPHFPLRCHPILIFQNTYPLNFDIFFTTYYWRMPPPASDCELSHCSPASSAHFFLVNNIAGMWLVWVPAFFFSLALSFHRFLLASFFPTPQSIRWPVCPNGADNPLMFLLPRDPCCLPDEQVPAAPRVQHVPLRDGDAAVHLPPGAQGPNRAPDGPHISLLRLARPQCALVFGVCSSISF